MTSRELEFIGLKFVDKKSFREIGVLKTLSPERVRQIINQGLGKLISEVELNKWKIRNGLQKFDDGLMTLIYLIGPEFTNRVRNLISYLGIKTPADFRKHNLSKPLIKGIGPIIGLKIKLGLLKMGVPYNADDMEAIENELINFYDQDDLGLQLRFKVLSRDGFTCQYCGRGPRKDPSVILNVDHIKPIAKGGTHTEDNLVTSCRECNIGKGDARVVLG
jgi:hypothetical protein